MVDIAKTENIDSGVWLRSNVLTAFIAKNHGDIATRLVIDKVPILRLVLFPVCEASPVQTLEEGDSLVVGDQIAEHYRHAEIAVQLAEKWLTFLILLLFF